MSPFFITFKPHSILYIMPKIVVSIFVGYMLIQSLTMIKAYSTVNTKQEQQAEELCNQYPQVCK